MSDWIHHVNLTRIKERNMANTLVRREPDFNKLTNKQLVALYKKLRDKYIGLLVEISYLKGKIDRLTTGKDNLKTLRENVEALKRTKLLREQSELINEINKEVKE